MCNIDKKLELCLQHVCLVVFVVDFIGVVVTTVLVSVRFLFCFDPESVCDTVEA